MPPRHQPPGPATRADLDGLISVLRAELPRFDVRFKDESRLQRAIGLVLRPFNGAYVTHYTTVMFGRVYFPSRAWMEERGPDAVWRILRHEAVHLRDAQRWPLLFELTYLLLPLPAVLTLRALWEWRAYRETLCAHAERHGEIPDTMLDEVQAAFVGPDYLFMWPFRGHVRRKLAALRREILDALR